MSCAVPPTASRWHERSVKAIADLWPLLVIAALGFCAYAVIRLAKRFSPGAVSAGPKAPPDSLIKGQTETAEDLRTIERRLDTRPGSMITRIQSSCAELGVATDGIPPGSAPEHHIDVLLGRLEAHLGFAASHLTHTDPAVDAATEGPTS